MKDNKSSFLLALSLFLLSLSLVLLSIWGYHFFYTEQKKNIPDTKKTVAAPEVNMHDSLVRVYTATVNKINARIDSTKNSADSLMDNVGEKLTEINALKQEIDVILKNKSNTSTSLNSARDKIDELQTKVAQLQNRNLDIEKENKHLKALLRELSEDKTGKSQPANTAPPRSIPTVGKPASTLPFIVKNIRITALQVKTEKDAETFIASETERINGSFTIKSNSSNANADIIISVLQPNGKVLQNSDWDAGTFETTEGRKIYSRKIHTSFLAGEEKELGFSLSAEIFDKGSYIVLIYFNGSVIGRSVKVLS